MTEIELAYIAGYFDGEGSVFVNYPRASNGKRYKKLNAKIAQTDRTLLDQIAEEFGGKVYSKSDKRVTENNWQECYDVVFAYRRAETFLRAILPYLRQKRQDVLDALNEAYE